MLDVITNALKGHAAVLDSSSGQAKFGSVSSVDSENNCVRVIIQPDGVLSGWLPVLSHWVGDGWGMMCPPSPGDQVFLVPQEGDGEQGVILGRTFSASQKAPKTPSGEFWLVHRSGSFLQLRNDGTIHVGGDLHVSGEVLDHHGSLSSLRSAYNSHIHAMQSNGRTTTPFPTD